MTLPELLHIMRSAGWLVAVHNDYSQDGEFFTFWLFTNRHTSQFVKGEGRTDIIAVCQAAEKTGIHL